MTEITQGSDFWKRMRLGKVTASRVFSIIDTDRSGKPKAERANYMHELAIERLTQVPTENVVNRFMANGTRQEPIARVTYSLLHDVKVHQVLFVDHPEIQNSGYSPDGLVGDGLIEIKAPQLKTHCEYLLSEKVPPQYLTQIHWGFACMPERNWCDFISYCDQAPTELRMWVKRIERDDAFVKRLEDEVIKFLAELDDLTERLQAKFN